MPGALWIMSSEREKTVTVYPNVQAGFMADTNMGCNPLTVSLPIQRWVLSIHLIRFGILTLTSKAISQILRIRSLTARQPIIPQCAADCLFDGRMYDTAYYPVTVHPYIKANFGIDNLIGCSPFVSNVNPSGSEGVFTITGRFMIRTQPITIVS